jgi:hypothetical protein
MTAQCALFKIEQQPSLSRLWVPWYQSREKVGPGGYLFPETLFFPTIENRE